MPEAVYTACEPRPSTSKSATKRQKKKGKKSTGKKIEKPYRYPTREELEETSRKSAVAKKLDEICAAEELTLQRYNELKCAGTMEVLANANPNPKHSKGTALEAGSMNRLPEHSLESQPNVVEKVNLCNIVRVY